MPFPDNNEDFDVLTESETRLKKPPMFKVLLHNDDYTSMEFVIYILSTVFHRSELDAVTIMLQVHNEGVGIAGVYTYEVAQMKTDKAINLARENQYPLLCTMEEE